MAHSVWTGGSRHPGRAALPHKNIQKFRKTAYESCKLLLEPTLTVIFSIILLKLTDRTPLDVSDTISNMSEQIVGSLFSLSISLVYYAILIILFSVINMIGNMISSLKKKNKQ